MLILLKFDRGVEWWFAELIEKLKVMVERLNDFESIGEIDYSRILFFCKIMEL